MSRHLLLWDGACGFCRRAVEGVRRRDRDNRFEIVPYQQAPVPPMTPELAAACGKALHVLTADGQLLRAGRAPCSCWPRRDTRGSPASLACLRWSGSSSLATRSSRGTAPSSRGYGGRRAEYLLVSETFRPTVY